MPRHVIAIETGSGRLANQLWHYAKVGAWCREHGASMLHSGILKFGKEFGAGHALGAPEGRPGGPLSRLKYGRRRKILHAYAGAIQRIGLAESVRATDPSHPVDLATLPMPQRKWTVLRGWYFENIDGLSRHRDWIVRVLAPAPDVAARSAKCLAHAEPGAIRVGVHIRAGDYRTWAGGKYFVPPAEYAEAIKQAAAKLASRGRTANFLLASDEPIPPEVSEVPGTIAGPGDAAADLATLSACDMVLSTYSTFAMWAAYVGDAPLVLLRTPPGEAPGLSLAEACAALCGDSRESHFARAIFRINTRL